MRIRGIEGLPIIDAKKPLDIEITDQDIAKADVKHPEGCAVARACVRALHALEARVHLGRVYIKTNPDHWVRYMTPKAMRAEIIAFDRGGTFEPGEFTLSAPYKSATTTGRRQGKSHPTDKMSSRKRSPKFKRRPPTVVKNVRTGPA